MTVDEAKSAYISFSKAVFSCSQDTDSEKHTLLMMSAIKELLKTWTGSEDTHMKPRKRGQLSEYGCQV